MGDLPRLAAIDVGTNSIRLVVAEVAADGTYRVLDEEREMTRLGRGLDDTGRISDESLQRSLETIGKMKAIADGFHVNELRAIATSAVREAANGRVFCREAQRRFRVRIDVIAPEEEAQLAFQSAVRHFNLDGRSVAVVDIGGGSVEIILAAGTVVDCVYSLPLGAVRLTERHCRSDPLKARHVRELRRRIERVVRDGLGKPPLRPDVMIGSGGTFANLGEMVLYQREGRSGSAHGYMITPGEVAHLLDRLIETPLAARRQFPGLNPMRADIIIAGAAVVARLVERLGTPQVLINERGIRDGLLLSMIADLRGSAAPAVAPGKDRLEWVRMFARKCRSNERHCEHVAKLALDLFDGLQAAYDLPVPAREVLHSAALLHDIGYLINHTGHHKHAYHLIMHHDLPGFAPLEVELIANVARYHRRAFPKTKHANLARFDKPKRQLIGRLAGILRVADGLDRTHAHTVSGVRCEIHDGRVRMLLETRADPQVEVWDAERKAGLFEQAFEARIEFVWPLTPGGGVKGRPARAAKASRNGARPRGAEPRRLGDETKPSRCPRPAAGSDEQARATAAEATRRGGPPRSATRDKVAGE